LAERSVSAMGISGKRTRADVAERETDAE